MNEHEIERLREALRGLAREMEKSAQAPAALENTLLRDFRNHHARVRLWRAVRIAGVAACVIVLFGTASMVVPKSVPVPPQAPEYGRSARSPAPPSLPETAVPTIVQAPVVTAQKVVRRRIERRRSIPQPAAPREVMTGFLPVGYGAELGPGERASLVRVRLPRSALASFGLPLNENRSIETVNADVLLGEDGLARAIRFVQ